jgi:hypothetical protein
LRDKVLSDIWYPFVFIEILDIVRLLWESLISKDLQLLVMWSRAYRSSGIRSCMTRAYESSRVVTSLKRLLLHIGARYLWFVSLDSRVILRYSQSQMLQCIWAGRLGRVGRSAQSGWADWAQIISMGLVDQGDWYFQTMYVQFYLWDPILCLTLILFFNYYYFLTGN